MEKLLITGGAGFVGSNLAVFLKHKNSAWEVIALDNLRRKGSELNVSRLRKNQVRFMHGDIRVANDIEAAGEFDLLIDCSAETSVLSGYRESPVYLYQTNLAGTLNCLEACRRHKAGIIFLSTSRVYPIQLINSLNYLEDQTRFRLDPVQDIPGITKSGVSEDFPLTGVRSLYGASKYCSELMLQEYMHAYSLKGIVNRCGVIAGPRQMGQVKQGFVALWVARHLWHGDLTYIGYGGQGKQVRDILHISDLCELLYHQIKRLDEINGQVFNIGGGNGVSVSLCELTQICQKITGHKIPFTSVVETRAGDIPYYISDCRKVGRAIGWEPRLNVENIVTDIYEWLRKNENVLKPVLG